MSATRAVVLLIAYGLVFTGGYQLGANDLMGAVVLICLGILLQIVVL